LGIKIDFEGSIVRDRGLNITPTLVHDECGHGLACTNLEDDLKLTAEEEETLSDFLEAMKPKILSAKGKTDLITHHIRLKAGA
jgi:hypothetical protein